MAIGYSVFGQLGLFCAMGLIEISDDEVQQLVALLRKNATYLSPETVDKNTAKFLAYSVVEKMVALVGAEHLEAHYTSSIISSTRMQKLYRLFDHSRVKSSLYGKFIFSETHER